MHPADDAGPAGARLAADELHAGSVYASQNARSMCVTDRYSRRRGRGIDAGFAHAAWARLDRAVANQGLLSAAS
jgi:hypothetical protein